MAIPKNYTDIDREIDQIRSHIGMKAQNPCYIIANGPSSSETHLSSEEISTSTIIRMNWFFLEESMNFGQRVDLFLWSVKNDGLRDRLNDIIRNGTYDIGAICQPFQPPDLISRGHYESGIGKIPNFDHWAVIANDPVLARFMMGRPLPTQGMQALAFAAIIGFEDIRLCGVDMYEGGSSRYPWSVPEDVKVHLEEKDTTLGYEDKHSLDSDLIFLRAIRKRYNFKLTGISNMERLAPILDERIPSKGNRRKVLNQTESKFAYVTLANGRYGIGAAALARSLQKVSDKPLVVLYSDNENVPLLSGIGNVELEKIDHIKNPHSHGQSRFLETFSKIQCFNLTRFERVIYIDADCIVLSSIDELFETNGILVAPDWGFEIRDGFNSGVMVFDPSEETYNELIDGIENFDSDDGGDQGYLNEILGDRVRVMPPEYNTLKRLLVSHPALIALSEVKVLHFVGNKPWDIHIKEKEYTAYERLWASFLTEREWSYLYWMSKTFLSKRVRSSKKSIKYKKISQLDAMIDAIRLKRSKLFDANWYLERYPDVKKSRMSPYIHYIRYGYKEGRLPSEKFDGNRYYELNRDVRESGMNPLIHYIRYGRKEGREK